METVKAVADIEFGLEFDPTLVRGMGYYTGTIFEVSMEGFGGSVAGGGRYDKLIAPATGASVSRFIAAWALICPVPAITRHAPDAIRNFSVFLIRTSYSSVRSVPSFYLKLSISSVCRIFSFYKISVFFYVKNELCLKISLCRCHAVCTVRCRCQNLAQRLGPDISGCKYARNARLTALIRPDIALLIKL